MFLTSTSPPEEPLTACGGDMLAMETQDARQPLETVLRSCWLFGTRGKSPFLDKPKPFSATHNSASEYEW